MEGLPQHWTELIERSLRGDVEAYRLIVEGHQEFVIRIAYRISNDFHRAEEIAQDVFVKAYQKLSLFDQSRGEFRSWLGAIAANEARNAHRKSIPFPLPVIPETTDDKASPSEATERRDAFRRLDLLINKLEEPFRTAFLLAEVEELSLREISEIEGAPIGTIKSRVSRAKAALRKALKHQSSQNHG